MQTTLPTFAPNVYMGAANGIMTAFPASATWMNVSHYAAFTQANPIPAHIEKLSQLMKHALSMSGDIHFIEGQSALEPPYVDDHTRKALAITKKDAFRISRRAFNRDAHVGIISGVLADRIRQNVFERSTLDKDYSSPYNSLISSQIPFGDISGLSDEPLFTGPEAFSGWSARQLVALAMIGGLRGGIQLQHGCPVQCFGCCEIANEVDRSKDMDWPHQILLAKGIARVTRLFRETGVDWNIVDPDRSLLLFRGDDPVFIRAYDPETQTYKGLADSASLFYKATDASISATTSGAPMENAFFRDNFERFLRALSQSPGAEKIKGSTMLSVKLFSRDTRRELNRVLDEVYKFVFTAEENVINSRLSKPLQRVVAWARQNFGPTYAMDPAGFKDRSDLIGIVPPKEVTGYQGEPWTSRLIRELGHSYFESSRYMRKLRQNLKLIKEHTAADQGEILSVQYLSDEDRATLPPGLKRYSEVFSKEFVSNVFESAYLAVTGENRGEDLLADRAFFLSEQDDQSELFFLRLNWYSPIIERLNGSTNEAELELEKVHAMIGPDGTLQMFKAETYAQPSRQRFNKEYFIRRAEKLRTIAQNGWPPIRTLEELRSGEQRGSTPKQTLMAQAALFETFADIIGKSVFPEK